MNKYCAILFCASIHAVVVTFVFYDDETPIRRHFDKEEYAEPVLFCTIVAVVLTCFSLTAISDPGRIKDAAKRKRAAQAGSMQPGLAPTHIDPHCRFCTTCEMWQTLRSKHCRSCKQCIATYDHHCIWMGNCIGEGNHAYFWWFLFSETALTGWGLYQVIQTAQSHDDLHESMRRNGFAIATGIMIVFLSWLPIALWAFHTYLLLANVTTWEFNRFDRISYLRGLGSGARPFSKGVCTNLRLMCLGEPSTQDSGLIKWGDYFDALPCLNAAVSKTWTTTANRFLSSPEKQGKVGNKIEKLPIVKLKSDVPAPNVDGGDSQHKIFIA
jgi:palmitoyltransferase